MSKEPTPIRDVFDAWLMRDQLRVFAEIAVVSGIVFYLARYFEIMWVMAGSSVSFLMFGTIAASGYAWRRFKRWRYPSYYKTKEEAVVEQPDRE